MGKRFVIAAKDIGAANVTLPVGRALSALGHDVYVAATGRAKEVFDKEGAFRRVVMNDPAHALAHLAPAAVVTGLSWPMAIDGFAVEEACGLAANELGIPLVHVEDFWVSSCRSKASSQLIGVVDEEGKRIAKGRYPKARVVLSGNPGVRPSPHAAAPAATERVRAFREKYGHAIVLVLGIEVDVALFAARCFEQTSEPFGIIVRVHPKVLQPGSDSIPGTKEKYADHFAKHLLRWQDHIETMREFSTDDIAVCSDVVVAGASTVLLTAAQAGVPVVSFWTACTKRIVGESSGCSIYPPVALGMPSLTKPENLAAYLEQVPQSLVAALRPYDPSPIVEAILEMAS